MVHRIKFTTKWQRYEEPTEVWNPATKMMEETTEVYWAKKDKKGNVAVKFGEGKPKSDKKTKWVDIGIAKIGF